MEPRPGNRTEMIRYLVKRKNRLGSERSFVTVSRPWTSAAGATTSDQVTAPAKLVVLCSRKPGSESGQETVR